MRSGATARRTPSTTTWVVVLTGIGSLMAALDTTAVSTALSTIRTSLHASVSQLEWTVNAYNLTFAVLLITGSTLGDRYGRRRMFSVGLALFALASAACALAPNVGTLIAARAVQGAGAALVMPLCFALLTAAFPPERRGAAIGMFSAITGIAVAGGPLAGGAIVSGISWEWIFWINVPIGLIAAVLATRRIPESHGPRRPLDTVGLALVTAGAFGVVWGLVRGNAAGWASTEVLVSLIAGTALFVGFFTWEGRAPSAMLPVELFRSRTFTASNIAVACTAASLYAAVFFYAQLLEFVLHDGPLSTGLRLLPWTATFITIAPGAGALADRVGAKPLLVVGLTLQAIGMVWMALTAGTDTSYGALIGPFIVAGAGTSLAFPAGQMAAVSAVREEMIGAATGANSMTRQLGGVLGVAIAVAVFSGNGGYGSPQAFIDGFGPAIWAGAAVAAFGAIAGALLPGRAHAVAPLDMAEAARP